ncbi:14517_t:CDS:2 [Funneliformis mosseae]|uniref:14517_t:CDS:1 n=1 Tax=Funneliformis mosseae TaxID=27381 RepID=A0A9N8ZG67_FUNMO|nr:14517_t:CDS:2 [Funneliformis mosseae]
MKADGIMKQNDETYDEILKITQSMIGIISYEDNKCFIDFGIRNFTSINDQPSNPVYANDLCHQGDQGDLGVHIYSDRQ